MSPAEHALFPSYRAKTLLRYNPERATLSCKRSLSGVGLLLRKELAAPNLGFYSSCP
jgi:hypothetical protein